MQGLAGEEEEERGGLVVVEGCAISSLYVKPQILFNNILEEVLRERPGKEGSGIYQLAPPTAHRTEAAKSTIITLLRDAGVLSIKGASRARPRNTRIPRLARRSEQSGHVRLRFVGEVLGEGEHRRGAAHVRRAAPRPPLREPEDNEWSGK